MGKVRVDVLIVIVPIVIVPIVSMLALRDSLFNMSGAVFIFSIAKIAIQRQQLCHICIFAFLLMKIIMQEQ